MSRSRSRSGTPSGDSSGASRDSLERSRSRSPARPEVDMREDSREREHSRDRHHRRSSAEGDEALDFDWKNRMLDMLRDNNFSKNSISDEVLKDLEDMDDKLAANVIKRVAESNLSNVRNIDGFTRSIMRRIQQQGVDVGSGSLRELDGQLQRTINNFKELEEDFKDLQVLGALKDMDVALAIDAVEQFARSNLANVRNRVGFMMSIIRRLKEEGRGGGRSGYDRGYDRGRSYDDDRRGYSDRYQREPPSRYDRRDNGYDRYDRGMTDRYDRGGYDSRDRYDRDAYDRRGRF